VIGAGASGLCAAIQLGQSGFPYQVLEKNDDIGGTWYENRYPGCAVDLPSHHYEYSFERASDWPDYYSRQPSVLAYLRRCADKYNVREHVRFGMEVQSAAYDEARQLWSVRARTRAGVDEQFEASAIIFAVGQLNRPAIPDFDGLAEFGGEHFHTACWPDGAELRNRRVALVGTGPSAVQVGPAIAPEVASLHVFQRSGGWCAPRPNIERSVSEAAKWVLGNVPCYVEWYRFQLFWAFGDTLLEAFKIDPAWPGEGESISEVNARHRARLLRHMQRELEGREDLLERAVPKYPPYCKRVIADPGWYRMLRRPNVALVETPIRRIEPHGIRTADDAVVPVDTIVFATGFQADRMLSSMEVAGRGGRTLRALWREDDPRAYLGIAVPGFPNAFILYGPNSNFAHGGSAIFMAECQVNYVMRLLDEMARAGHAVAEVRQDVHDRYNARLDAALETFSWNHPAAQSWYRNASGRIVANQPWRLVDYWNLTREPALEDYVFEPPRAPTTR
jgi:4-hydroxyacetophenone monooxygenase